MRFRIDDDRLTITLEGIEVFWTLKRKLVVPRSHVVQAVWTEDFVISRGELGFRFGSVIPGYLFAGTFVGATHGRSFLYMEHARGLLQHIGAPHILQLQLRDQPYDRILVTVDDAAMADQIVAWASQVA
jgi:hypothetical protein